MDCEARTGRRAPGYPDPSSFHSRYAPEIEAERHARACLGSRRPAVVYVIGGGLGYINAALADILPKAIVVSLQPCDLFDGLEVRKPSACWRPGSLEPLGSVIARSLSDGRLSGGVSVIEWSPVTRRFPEESERIRRTLRDALEAASSDAATSAYWAARWLRNSARFAIAARREAGVRYGSRTVVIACAGPSLERYVPELVRRRGDIALWSLASAVPALVAGGLEPDLAIATDPGFWSAMHLRAIAGLGIPLAIAPSAYATEAALERCPVLSIDTGLPFERAAIGAAGFTGRRSQAAGSAAGTALSLALSCTSGPVTLVGYDLAALGFDDHARPYPFDSLDQAASSRTRPEAASRASRALDGYQASENGWRVSRAFSAYASTIRAPASDGDRVFRLSASPVPTPFSAIGSLDDVIETHGERPSIVAPDTVRPDAPSCSFSARRRAYYDGLSELLDSSLTAAAEAISRSSAMPFDAMTVYRSLAAEAAAPVIASMARGEASERDLLAVDARARAALLLMSGGYDD